MRRSLSDQEVHALYCPVKNAKSAMFLVAYFSVAAFASWKGLRKPPENPSLVELLFAILVVAMLAKWLLAFTCLRERLVFGLVIISLTTGEVTRFARFDAEIVKSGKLWLSLLGLIVSLTMLVQSARSPNVGPSNGETSIASHALHSKGRIPILVVTLGILVLGALIYFLPLR